MGTASPSRRARYSPTELWTVPDERRRNRRPGGSLPWRTDVKRERAKSVQYVENLVSVEGMRIGRIESIDESERVLVDFPGNTRGPLVARTTSSVIAEIFRKENPPGREVLLAFENNDQRFPIIIDTMYSLIEEITEPATVAIDAEAPQEVTIDGKRISFEAENEIVLKCGKASITLTKAGKILIKGNYVLSHSSGENRIRGGAVSIN
jgi:hypothetical protein